ncbi:hypothetical protein [Mucilaginibacter sp. UR6-11]|uniref:hypothetical protein n=1 Tax=Mucilaginibacter sp. UR6-11 TaxID=1435644 RepID=UPI001E377F1A|nr:hypothetical protein [Mucilaginibacter sp. UR6-11]MCC8423937.1 hypothetical protein [Mucilaginibacter sp. UR6-11]
MKPTAQEKQWLQEYLYQALTYRETYDEVYDHILLALEHKEAQPFFESTVYQIIDEDFGGSINMLNMEVDCRSAVDAEVKAQYWHNAIEWLKPPLLGYTIVILAIIFFLQRSRYALIAQGIFALIVIFVPVILISIRSFSLGKKYGDTKASIRDSGFRWLIYGFFIINMVLLRPIVILISFILQEMLGYPTKEAYLHSNFALFIGTTISMIWVIHLFSLVKLYRDEFKTGMVTS